MTQKVAHDGSSVDVTSLGYHRMLVPEQVYADQIKRYGHPAARQMEPP